MAAETRPVRNPADVVRVVAGSLCIGAGAVVARRARLSGLETDLFRVANDLPGFFEVPLRSVMQAGSLGAVPAAGVVALATRRPRLARDLTLAGGGAWVAAKALKSITGRGRPGALLQNVVFRGGRDSGLGYPSGHAAVAAALATSARPHLGRTGRRAASGTVAVVGVGRIFVGAHLPVDVMGGAALGWVLGALVHLLFGEPGGGIDRSCVSSNSPIAPSGPVPRTR